MPDLGSCVPFPIEEAVLTEVVSKAKDWALMHGAAMRSKANFSEDSLQVHIKNQNFFFHLNLFLKTPAEMRFCLYHLTDWLCSS